jgi:hypothetical protein
MRAFPTLTKPGKTKAALDGAAFLTPIKPEKDEGPHLCGPS